MRKIRRLVVLGAGAAAAYLLDPSAGHGRRARLVAFVKSKRNRQLQSAVDHANSVSDVTVVIVAEPDVEVVEPQVVDVN